MKQWVAGIAVAVVFLVGVGHADDESDRRDLLRSIDDKVKSMASELDGFESDSDVGDLDDALSYARDVKDLVSKLNDKKGSDSRANDVASRYPGYLDSFREAARYLKKMKEGQRRADGIAEKCAQDEGDLQQIIRNWVGNPDSAPDDATTRLLEKGRAYGRTWTEQMSKLREIGNEMASSSGYARFSTSDSNGYFNDVANKFERARSEIHEYWRRRYEAATNACNRLAQGERHSDLEKAIEALSRHGTSTKGTVTQLKKDYNEWLRKVRTLREFTIKDRDEIRDLMCNRAGEYEMQQRVNEVADRWASQISGEYGTVLGLGDRLKDRANDSKLARFKGPKDVLAGLRANFENLEKLKNYELRGANNPKIRTRIEYGKQKHKDMQSSMCSSGYAEFKISSSHCSNAIRPGSGCIADCVLPGSTCIVIEIKPDSERAKSEGNEQRAAYAEGLRRWYLANKVELLKEHPKLQACEDSSGTRLNVDSRLETYEFCPRNASDLTEEMREPTSDLSESE